MNVLSPAFLALVTLSIASGTGCVQSSRSSQSYLDAGPPRAMTDGPSKEQIMEVVHRNTVRVRSYTSHSAVISAQGTSLKADLAVERPRRFRLRGRTALAGPEVDLGSNENLFWVWVRRNEPPALYFCRHDQFINSGARQIIPIEPQWFVEALGLVEFDPQARHKGPFQRQQGILEIHSHYLQRTGDLIKITMVDAQHGWVLEQHLFGPQGERLASTFARAHRRDPATGVVLPEQVEIHVPAVSLSLKIDVRDYRINQLKDYSAELWAKPNYPGFIPVDLATVSFDKTPVVDPIRSVPEGAPAWFPRENARAGRRPY